MSRRRELPIGPIVCEPGSSSKYKTGTWRTMRPVLDKNKCNKCGICWVYCPEGAVVYLPDGFFEPNLDYCKGCGICAKECPTNALSMKEE